MYLFFLAYILHCSGSIFVWLRFIMASIQFNKHQQIRKFIKDEIPPLWNKYLCAKRENLDNALPTSILMAGLNVLNEGVLLEQMIPLYPSASRTPEYMSVNISTNTSASAAERLAEPRASDGRSSDQLGCFSEWL